MAELPGVVFCCPCGRLFAARPIACECGADMRSTRLIEVTSTGDIEGSCGAFNVAAAELEPPKRRKR